MRLFRCQVCEQTAYFENTRCERCHSPLGYLPDVGLMSALEPAIAPDLLATLHQTGLLEGVGLQSADAGEAWLAHVRPGRSYRFCANAGVAACNWMIPSEADELYCVACRHNHRIPDLSLDDNLVRWRQLELAKHRLFYSLVKLQLPLASRRESPDGLAFDFLADPPDPKAPRVMTGHARGLITIALREADDVEREKMRKSMGEPYRTLLGHFRHETGHYFWDQLVRENSHLQACRAVFGDDRTDYGEALETYYAKGAPPGWQDRFISAYATMHPWEDFAETWAHYLHMIDTLEAAAAHGLELHGRDRSGRVRTAINFDPYQVRNFDRIIGCWLPLSRAANSMNRAMGQPDLYPFVLSPVVIGKLRFIHGLVQAHRARRGISMAPA